MGAHVKDIDFDELDKAVSSVLNQSPNETADNDTAAVTSDTPSPITSDETTNDTADPVDSSTNDTADDTPETETTSPEAETEASSDDEPVIEAPDDATDMTTNDPAPSLAAKRRGKFMDMVHPSSDMTPGTDIAKPESPAVERKVLTPISDDMTSDADSPVESDDTTEASKDSEPADTSASAADTTETSSETTDDAEAPLSESTDDEQPPVAMPKESTDTAETDSSPESVVDQQTPFISDAVVEKRPLGAFGDSEEPAIEVSESEIAADDSTLDSGTGLPGAMPVASAPTPRELQADIVKVEAVDDDAEPGGNSEAQDTEAPMTMAIPTASSDRPDDSHHLFDTASYHQPLAATTMPSTGVPMWVWWMVGLLVCLLVGGGIGYVLYAGGF